MKIGVVCEGMTDYIAISHYVGSALRKREIESQFVALQPTPDNTSAGGWANVLTWLQNHPPKQRSVFFEKGLFANSTRASNLDFIILQLDTDILRENSAINFLKQHKIEFKEGKTLADKAHHIDTVLRHFSNFDLLNVDQKIRHITAPVSESSEAWCIAADPDFEGNPEELSGMDLCNAFGAALARFNREPLKRKYVNINKRQQSRERYCKITSEKVELIERCLLFKRLVDDLHSKREHSVRK